MPYRFPGVLVVAIACCACSKRDEPLPSSRASSVVSSLSKYVFETAPPISHPLDISFEDKVTLLGYDIEPAGALPRGQEIRLRLYWMLNEKLSGRWKLLTHVLDPFGGIVRDLYNAGPLRVGKRGHPRLPPSKWAVGKVYADELSFELPARLGARTLRIVAGVYSTNTVAMTVARGSSKDGQRALIATLDVAIDDPGTTLQKLGPADRIAIDGRLSEPAWQDTSILGPFLDVAYGEPTRAAPLVRGQARMLWDSRGLYLGYEVVDEDIEGFSAAAVRPELWTKDAVVLVVNAEGGGGGDYELQINPQNIVVGSQHDAGGAPTREGRPAPMRAWHARAKSAVVVEGTLDVHGDRDRGWVVEAMIPWQSFERSSGEPPADGSAWKMNLYAMNQGASAGWSPSFAKEDFRRAPRLGNVVFAPRSP